MEENTSLWNKKTSDLTVGDIVKVNIIVPAVVLGGMFAFGAAANVASKLSSKIRKNRSTETETETE